ncbi:unnamed protein product [Aphanomyces euteiches]
MFTLHFKIKNTAASGDTAITIVSGTYTTNTQPKTIQTENFTSGKVSVTASPKTVVVGAGTVSGSVGSTVSVPVSVISTSSTGIASYGIQLDFDNTALEVTEITTGADHYFYSFYDNAQGWLKASWVDASGGDHTTAAGDLLFTVKFKIKSGASSGDKPLNVNPADVLHFTFTDVSMNEMDKTWAASKVTVASVSQSPSSPPPAPTPVPTDIDRTNTDVNVLVNGKIENAGTATTAKVNGQTVTTVVLDQKKLEERLAAEGQHAVITIPVSSAADAVIGELNGQMIQNMEQKQAVVVIKTDRATYTLPAEQINIGAISRQLGKNIELKDIKLQIGIASPTADTIKIVENAAAQGGFALVIPPLNFTVKGIYGDQTIEVEQFNAFVERRLAIPDGVDPNKITTGIVVEPEGTVRHVPTKVVLIDGKYYAQVNSLTNSTYSIVWHPLEFKDVSAHWAEAAVNDMASRMVIEGASSDLFNPDRDITRAEFAAIIVRSLGLKLVSGAFPFADVKSSDWFHDAVQTAYSFKLINGFEDATFNPADAITREQAMVIIAKAMAITGLKGTLPPVAPEELLSRFKDADNVSNWARSSMADNLQALIVTGRTNSTIAPKAYISRAEVAVMVQRLLQKSGLI